MLEGHLSGGGFRACLGSVAVSLLLAGESGLLSLIPFLLGLFELVLRETVSNFSVFNLQKKALRIEKSTYKSFLVIEIPRPCDHLLEVGVIVD